MRRLGKPARFAIDGTPFNHAKKLVEPESEVDLPVGDLEMAEAKRSAGGISFLL